MRLLEDSQRPQSLGTRECQIVEGHHTGMDLR